VPTANTGAYTLYLQALVLDANFAAAWALLADVESATMVFGTTRALRESRRTHDRSGAAGARAGSMHWRLALVLLSAGRPQDALDMANAESSPGWAPPGQDHRPGCPRAARGSRPQIDAHRGDREHAFAQLERARQARDPGLMSYLKCDPMLAPLRNDPRYKAMLGQLNLPSWRLM
jgi:hypothetical protein